MIRSALYLLFVGYLILVVSFILEEQLHKSPKTHITIDIIYTVAFILITAGGGEFESSVIPFGVDQLAGASSKEISSYFHFLYFACNLGYALGLLVYWPVSFIISYTDNSKVYNVFQPFVTVVILTFGVLLHQCLCHWYFKTDQGRTQLS